MKKIFFNSAIVAGAALMLASCSNDEPLVNGAGGDGTVSFTIEVPAGLATRAESNINKGIHVNRLQVAVFDKDDKFLFQQSHNFVSGQTVNVSLITGEEFTVAFWADKKEGSPYTIDDKGQLIVDYTEPVANDDSRDAFYAARKIVVDESNKTQSISLVRPFAQVNLGTDDYAVLTGTYNCTPTQSTMTVKGCAYDKMNLCDGNVIDGPVDVTFDIAGMPEYNSTTNTPQTLTSAGKDYAWVGMNYILCAKTGGTITDLTFATEKDKLGTRSYTKGAPVKRNMRTNLVGSLFTTASGWTVDIESGLYEPWDGTTATMPTIDEEKQTVDINKPTDLAGLAALVNGTNNPSPLPGLTRDGNQIRDFDDFTITLNCDVDLNNMEWTPIGNGSRDNETYTGNAFKGTFDGNGHTIYGLKISEGGKNDARGLFGIIDGGVVKNLVISDANINTPNCENVAIVTGLLVGGGKVEYITTSGKVVAKRGCSGIVGRLMIDGKILNCVNNATVNGTGENVGGIVGAAYYTRENKEMVIDNCVNNGKITSTAGGTGGIVGLSAAWVRNCVNDAEIVGNGASVGGIVGEQQNAGHVTKCVNKENVTNNSAAYGTGGIIGWLRYNGTEANYTAKNIITVSECVNSGSVTGGNDAGGIIGTLYNLGKVNDNENYAEILKGQSFAGGIVGNLQFTEEAIGMTEPDNVEIKNNVSTTLLENINAGCKGLYFYDNDNNQGKVTSENNRQSKNQ